MNNLRLSEMMCTKLCHDLTGPAGAISNGVEFLAEDGFDMQGQAIELISQSAAQCISRLQFYRVAYGKVNGQGESDLMQIRKLVQDYFAGSKITVNWPYEFTDPGNVTLDWNQTRLLLNMLIIASGTLIRGGDIDIALKMEGGRKSVTVTASGTAVKWDDASAQALQQETPDDSITPALSQLCFTYTMLQQIGWGIKIATDETTFTLEVSG
jgi:histidine phosphotransferase ChpT